MAGDPINGKDVLLLVEDVEGSGQYIVVGRQRNVSFNSEVAEIDASSKDDDEVASALPGRATETVDLEHLYVPSEAAHRRLVQARRKRETIMVRRNEFGNAVEQAPAFVASISEQFPDGEAATVTASLRIKAQWQAVSLAGS